MLATFPFSGRMVPEFEQNDLRELIQRPYRIVYLAKEDVVTILRVVHGARDMLGVSEREPWDSIQ